MNYPEFTEIDSSHKPIIDSITNRFPPYCDFQFSNLLSWSSNKSPTAFSLLDGNLIVRMKEYDTANVIYMFMGNNNLKECLNLALLNHNKLERVPEETIVSMSDPEGEFNITEDITNNDNVLDLNNVVTLPGNKFKSKRRNIHGFIKSYPSHEVIIFDPGNPDLPRILTNFFQGIAEEKDVPMEKLSDELAAVEKLLKYQNIFNLPILGLMNDKKLIGFTINEILNGNNHNTALGCFGKGLRKYKGIYAYLEYITAGYLIDHGINFINLEEDLGKPGLHESKSLWRPVKILRKYVIQK